MEFLKDLFTSGALTFEQFTDAAKKAGFQVVNAAGGAYVPKADADNLQTQINTLTTNLNTANEKLNGFDPDWKTKAEDAAKQLSSMKLDFAIEKGLSAAGARSAKAVRGLLDTSKLTIADDGELIGLEKQLDALKKGEDTAFLFAQEMQQKSGMSHQGGNEGKLDKKDEANAALRTLFGKEIE